MIVPNQGETCNQMLPISLQSRSYVQPTYNFYYLLISPCYGNEWLAENKQLLLHGETADKNVRLLSDQFGIC
jgi:hypothetical protein